MKFKEDRPLYQLEEIASILRGENGCAWDRKQTPDSLKSYLIEEAYEAYDAIEKRDSECIKEELGDLLFQVFSHAQIAKEEQKYTIDDIAKGIADKLIRRHPHVFGDKQINDADEVIVNWEKIKKDEKTEGQSILSGVPKHLPALLMAYRVQQKVSRIGFDWERIEDVFNKIDEEVEELKEVVVKKDKELAMEEAGDLLFSLVNALRYMHINPEEALKKSIQKFMGRFNFIEQKVAAMNRDLIEMSLDELDALWEQAKK